MIFRFGLFSLVFMLLSCVAGPTKITQEVGGDKNRKSVLVDTRNSLEYSSYHVSGSVNLNSTDFLILKDPKLRSRSLDPDLSQVVERLARRGVSPLVGVTLIGTTGDSIEIKKWKWLLKKLDVADVAVIGLNEYIKANAPIRPQADPESLPVWTVYNSKLIIESANECFVSWSDEKCK